MGMVRRRTRRRTMMVAGGMAYNRGRNAGQAEAYQEQPGYEEPPPAPPAPAPATVDTTSEIEKLASLHDSGALSDDEFTAAKKKILGI
jgi:Short C-terminal domain